MNRCRWTKSNARVALAAGLFLMLGSCTPRYDQDFDAFRAGQTTLGRSSTTLPSSNTTLPGSPTTLPQRGIDKTTLPGGRTTLPGARR
jgi:hypothetical protein